MRAGVLGGLRESVTRGAAEINGTPELHGLRVSPMGTRGGSWCLSRVYAIISKPVAVGWLVETVAVVLRRSPRRRCVTPQTSTCSGGLCGWRCTWTFFFKKNVFRKSFTYSFRNLNRWLLSCSRFESSSFWNNTWFIYIISSSHIQMYVQHWWKTYERCAFQFLFREVYDALHTKVPHPAQLNLVW